MYRFLLLAALFLPLSASAQSLPDSLLRRELDSLRSVQTATTQYCATRRATNYMRAACVRLDSTIARLDRAVTPAAPSAVVTLTRVGGTASGFADYSTLQVRPGEPHNAFIGIQVDSAGQPLSDSAAVVSSDSNVIRTWYNRVARRAEAYTTTTTRPGTATVTARWGTATSTLSFTVLAADTTSPPLPDTTSPPLPDTTAPRDPAELPRVQVILPPAPTTCTITVTDGAQLQTTLNAAVDGSDICLPTGFRWTGTLTLPSRLTCAGYATLRWDNIGAVVPPGTRARPSVVAGAMPRLTALPGTSVIVTAPGACGWQLIGLEITTASDLNALLRLGTNNEPSLAAVPDRIILARSWVHGTATHHVTRCVMLFTRTGAVVDSWLDDCHSNNGDSQAILGGGAGPHLIANNYLAGGAENIMYGGFTPTPSGLIPQDITIRRNHISQPASWIGKWLKKNLLELKVGRRVLIEHNVIKGSWRSAQVGFALNLKSSGGWGGCVTEHVTVRQNDIGQAGSSITIGGTDPGCTVKSHHYTIVGNLFDSVNVAPYSGDGRHMQLIAPGDSIVVRGNLFAQSAGQTFLAIPDGSGVQGFSWIDNVSARGVYGIKGSGRAEGIPSLGAFDIAFQWSGNTLMGAISTAYPAGTVWVDSEAGEPRAATIRSVVQRATAGVVVPP